MSGEGSSSVAAIDFDPVFMCDRGQMEEIHDLDTFFFPHFFLFFFLLECSPPLLLLHCWGELMIIIDRPEGTGGY